MFTRRGMISSSIAAGGLGLHGCGVAPAAGGAAGAAAGETVAGLASAASAIANVTYAVIVAGGAIAKKKTTAILAAAEAVERGSQGVGAIARSARQESPEPRPQNLEIASSTEVGDTLLRLKSLEEELRAFIRFKEAPVLPGKQEPERVYIFRPVIWNGGTPITGKAYNIEAERLIGERYLYGPGYERSGITEPGVYRFGYQLMPLDEQEPMYGGGPFLHLFSEHQWSYERILSDYGEPRPENVESPLFAADPYDDVELRRRQISPTAEPPPGEPPRA